MNPRLLWLAALALILNACASVPEEPEIPPQRKFEDVYRDEDNYPLAVYDPLEGFNRGVYRFNAQFDRYVFLPIVTAYETATPDFVEDRISRFFRNLGEVTNFSNGVVQLRPRVAGTALLRFIGNSTIGLAGLFDPMTRLGIPELEEDFGQSLGYWGVSSGPYLVLPLVGPSNFRDAFGLAVDAFTYSPVVPNKIENSTANRAIQYGLRPVDKRHRTAFRYYSTGSPFEYQLIRFVYNKKRELDIKK